jgi:hypothetical protein
MLFNQAKKLPDLVRLRLVARRLQIELAPISGVAIHTVATLYAVKLKAECLNKTPKIRERGVVDCATGKPTQQLPLIHPVAHVVSNYLPAAMLILSTHPKLTA